MGVCLVAAHGAALLPPSSRLGLAGSWPSQGESSLLMATGKAHEQGEGAACPC
ncbi:Bidirectional sugar transporter SWEET [Psidium guajava]|nr:Bidirectional sugar transporter SWEET [Psidium guajava]